jgi:hypothetical protein
MEQVPQCYGLNDLKMRGIPGRVEIRREGVTNAPAFTQPQLTPTLRERGKRTRQSLMPETRARRLKEFVRLRKVGKTLIS